MPQFLKVNLKNLLSNRYYLVLLMVFLVGFFVRLYYVSPERVVFGYDQIGDLISARKIADNHDLIIKELFGSQIGINHGVLFSYFTALVYWFTAGNPLSITYGYVFLNCLSILTISLFCTSVFKKRLIGVIAGLLFAFSNYQILLSDWISNTSWAFVLIPVFFWGFWRYKERNNSGLVLSSFSLGLLIQSQMLMVYYILVVPIVFMVLKLKIPSLRTIILSGLVFFVAVSTMILAEIKSGFSSLKIFGDLGSSLGESRTSMFGRVNQFLADYIGLIQRNLNIENGVLISVIFVLVVFYGLYKTVRDNETKKELAGLKLVLVMLIAPLLMLIIGYHKQPWTLFGMIPGVFIFCGYLISKIHARTLLIFGFLTLFVFGFQKNLMANRLFIFQEPSSILQGQLEVLAYTYQEAGGEIFAINAVTYPLYYNTYWSYHYPWYSKKVDQTLPGWMGGDQLYPYDTLPKSNGREKIFFMIIDETRAISSLYKNIGRKWGLSEGKLISEKLVGGFTVQKFVRYEK